MEEGPYVPSTVDGLLEWHKGLLVHVTNVHREADGSVWIRADAPVKIPVFIFNPENWISVSMEPRPSGVLRLCARPGSDKGVVDWGNMAPSRCSSNSIWTLAEFADKA